jgi:hypothetical protein
MKSDRVVAQIETKSPEQKKGVFVAIKERPWELLLGLTKTPFFCEDL